MFTLATPDDAKFVDAIERLIKQPIPRLMLEGFTPRAPEAAPERAYRAPHDRPDAVRRDRSCCAPPVADRPRHDRPAAQADTLPDTTASFGDDLPAFLWLDRPAGPVIPDAYQFRKGGANPLRSGAGSLKKAPRLFR